MRVAQFWSAAMERPLDDGASEWFTSIEGKDRDRAEPAWYFEKVPERTAAKNRMRVDVFDPSTDVVERFIALGASVVGEHELPWAGHSWTVLQDPVNEHQRQKAPTTWRRSCSGRARCHGWVWSGQVRVPRVRMRPDDVAMSGGMDHSAWITAATVAPPSKSAPVPAHRRILGSADR